jgi:hypothetical protein
LNAIIHCINVLHLVLKTQLQFACDYELVSLVIKLEFLNITWSQSVTASECVMHCKMDTNGRNTIILEKPGQPEPFVSEIPFIAF